MSTGMETVDSGEVAPEAPQPTCIRVHIHQESALAKLLLSSCSLLQPLVPAPRPASRPLSSHRLLVASWAAQITLGILSGVLGGFLYIFYNSAMRASGAAIWTGAVAVLAGAVAFIYEKRGGIYWALLRTLLALGAFSTAMAAIITGASGFHKYSFYFYDSICDTSPSWGPTRPPGSPNPDVGRLRLCISYLDMLKALARSLQGLLLGVWVLLLLASLVPLCLYCWKRRRPKEKRDLPLEETAGSQ
ncbi:transmembrane protein 176A [Camelus dromedarius]|uniref:transmembrane protein 176A n=1 Tax=Camelus dromedarius TaxID=9838 RepID=UPI00057B9383